ncbi:hypothetical protein NQZ79_g6173 [Umbelopsis isabellina]|nr:hypothetical protein NQZ79_g6173 [Umbelopsis isabellina]
MEDSCRNLILEYLMHNCYGNAAKAFISDMRNLDSLNLHTSTLDKNGNVVHSIPENNTSDSEDHYGNILGQSTDTDMDWSSADQASEIHQTSDRRNGSKGAHSSAEERKWLQLDARKDLYHAIHNGDISTAMDLLSMHFPVLISAENITSRKVLFRLNCQRFIEIVRSGETLDALKFAQTTLRSMSSELSSNGTPEEVEALSSISSLIAYQNPSESPVGKYLEQAYRDETAEITNNAVLALAHLPVETRLERIVKQMQVVRAEISAQNSKDEMPSPYDDLGNIIQL